MKDQLYVYDCLTAKLRVSNGDFMAVGAGKQNTFRIRSEAENAGVFAQRNGTCRFFPHNRVASYSINGNRSSGVAHIKPERFYLFIISGGCFIAWYGNEDSRPDFSNFDADCWYTYHPENNEWSDEIKFATLLEQCDKLEDCVLATFYGLDHNAFRITDIREIASFLRSQSGSTAAAPTVTRQSVVYCPFCHEAFSPKQTPAIAVHPQLQGDTILGDQAMKRFIPTHYTPEGYVLDELGAECHEFACPHCHYKLPPFFEKSEHHRVAVLGAPASGKAYYLASLVHQLERELPRNFGIPFRDADPEQNTALNNMRVRVFYSNTPEEFREGRDFLTGKLHSKVWRRNAYENLPRPFIYSLNKERHAHTLVFYNGTTVCGQGSQDVLKFDKEALKHVNAVFYLFDPTQDPSFREVIEDMNPGIEFAMPASHCRQSVLLADIEMHLRKTLGLPLEGKIDIPISFILTKSDLWLGLLGPEPLLPTVRNGRLKLHNIQANSARMRDLLFRIAPEICSNAESISDNICYFAVSSFGTEPEVFTDELTANTYIAPVGGKLTPTHVTDPVMWVLAQNNHSIFADS